MSSWGVGVRFSTLQQVRDFSIFGSKSVTFYFFLFFLWGSKFWCSKVSFNYTLWVYRYGVYLHIRVIKNCRQHSYGFQNLMSSWGVGVRFSKLQQVRDFSIFGSKSVTFYFFLFFLWGSKFWCSKVSFNVLHTLCTFRTCIYIFLNI